MYLSECVALCWYMYDAMWFRWHDHDIMAVEFDKISYLQLLEI